MSSSSRQFVSRGGEKLAAALEGFALDPGGWVCCDFGCNVGGFVDCLLQRGAKKVWAVDTGYGDLAWKLRRDPRVELLERTNALYLEPTEPVDLVTADMSWTPLGLAVPAAMKWLRPGGRVLALLKPHFELAKLAGRKPRGPLSDEQAEDVLNEVSGRLSRAGFAVAGSIPSPLRGKGGNREYWLKLPK